MAWWPRHTPRDGDFTSEVFDGVYRDSCVPRVRRSRRDDQPFGFHVGQLLNRRLVVADHLDVGAQLREVLEQVVGEAVVVVDQKEHGSCLHYGLCMVDGVHERAHLVQGLFILGLGIGVGDDSAAGLQVGDAVAEGHRAERDRGVHVAGV